MARDRRGAEGLPQRSLRGTLAVLIRATQFTTQEWGYPMKRMFSVIALAVVFGATGASAQTLKTVKDRGILNCGANGTLAGFGLPDAQGKWAGLDVDFCRAVAAAVFAILAWAVMGSEAAFPHEQAAPQVTVAQIGNALMSQYVLPLEIVAVLLTAAMIGAVIVAMHEKKEAAK